MIDDLSLVRQFIALNESGRGVVRDALERIEIRLARAEEDSDQWWHVEEALHDYWFSQSAMSADEAIRKLLTERNKYREMARKFYEACHDSCDYWANIGAEEEFEGGEGR